MKTESPVLPQSFIRVEAFTQRYIARNEHTSLRKLKNKLKRFIQFTDYPVASGLVTHKEIRGGGDIFH